MTFWDRIKRLNIISNLGLIGSIFLTILIVLFSWSFLIKIPFQSDRASLYPIVDAFKNHDGARVWLSPDSYVLKYPIVWLIQSLFGMGIKAYFVFNMIEQVSMWILLAFFYLHYLKKTNSFSKLNFYILLIFLISTFNIKLMDGMIYRNIEIAFSLIYLIWIDVYIKTKKNNLTRVTFFVPFILTLSLFLYNDPFFSFVFFLPLAIYLFIRFIFSKEYILEYLFASGAIGISYVGSIIVTKIFERFNFYVFNAKASFPTYQKFIENINYFINDILYMYNGDVFGLRFPSVRTAYMLVSIFVLIISVIGLINQAREINRKGNSLLGFVPFVLLTNSIVFILKDNIEPNHLTIRYLVFVPFILILGLAYWLNKFKKTNIKAYLVVSGIILFLIAGNIYINKPTLDIKVFRANLLGNYRILSVLYKNKLNYGFSGYWSGLANTVLSNNQIKIRAIGCQNSQRIIPFYFITNEGWYSSQKNVDRYFILMDNSIFLQGCSETNLVNQFGKYNNKILIDGKIIYVWDKNITSLIPKLSPTEVRNEYHDN